MHIQIFFTLMILTIIVSGTAFAEDSLISVQTDDNDYDEGDTILISGEYPQLLVTHKLPCNYLKEIVQNLPMHVI